MKRLIKIIGMLCILLALSLNANAQWRFGLEINGGCNPGYTYDEKGFFLGKDKFQRLLGQSCIMADYLLPRRWTPNYLTLSTRIGLGAMYVTDSSCFDSSYSASNKDRTKAWVNGISIPIELEIKYLISNNTRLYVNGGVNPLITMDGTVADYFDFRDAMIGYQFGVGFEFRNFRIGYKNISMTQTISEVYGTEEEVGNKLKFSHAITIGFWFNGNRTLKKQSKLKAY